MDQKIKQVARRAADLGLPSFVLMAKNGSLLTFHFEKMNISSAMEMMMAGFQHTIGLELEQKGITNQGRKILIELSANFTKLIEETNNKMLSVVKK